MASEGQLPIYKWLYGVSFIAWLLICMPFLGISMTFPLISQNNSQIFNVEVINEYPHDPTAFTEGLLYGENNTLYESTGLYGQSSVRRVNLKTGKVVKLQEMPSTYFGEGLSLVGERLYQLTWLQKVGFIYEKSNLSEVGNFTHKMHEGWGLTTDGKALFGSDGSSTLYQIDLQKMKEIQRLTVTDKDIEVYNLNELEYVNGEIWANIIPTDCIVRISPEDGNVLGWIVLSNLRERLEANGEINTYDVLNGIAWDKGQDRIFVTGKNWPKLYEIKVYQTNNRSRDDIKKLCTSLSWSSGSYRED